MELILIQNNYIFNLKIRKTRRYRSLIKLYFTPWISILSYNELFYIMYHNIYQESSLYLIELKKFFQKDNIWYYYRNIIFANSGLITSNITKSYTYWNIKLVYNFIFNKKRLPGSIFKTDLCYYTKFIRILPFSIKKKSFKQIIIYMFKNLLRLYLPFKNCINISYCFILVNNEFNFFWLLNFYYFKIHNY